MAQLTIGRILPIFKGDWSSATTYSKLDIVYYNGSSYVAKTSSTGQAPILPSDYWMLVASKGSWGSSSEAEKAQIIQQLKEEIEYDVNEISIVEGSTTYNNY